MELLFLGTGASEAIPAVFCRCAYCSKARQTGGKDIRTRSSFRIDAKHQIDFSPDVFSQMITNGLGLYDLEHLLITHTHDDHFDLAEILERECAVPVADKPLNIYLSKYGEEWAKNLLISYFPHKDRKAVSKVLDTYRLIPIDYFETFQAGELEVTSLKANHISFGSGEYGQNYMIRLQDGRNILYALDTGWYREETWEFLKGKRVDILIMDCTFGGLLDRGIHPDGHLDIRSMLLMLEQMDAIGMIGPDTKHYATHINHKHGLPHEDMQRIFDHSKYQVTVAFDGLRIL